MKISDLWIDHPAMDWLASAAICGAVWRLGYLGVLPDQDRGSLYQTLVSVAVAVLGLGTVSVTLIVTGTPTEKLRSAITASGRGLVGLMFSCLFGCLVSAAMYTALYFFSSRQLALAGLLLLFATALLVFRTTRLIWLLRSVLNLLV
jgi:hypothetical protein